MKLLTRISSMRRIAWNACRSCSADSLSMCLLSLARKRLAGWMRSPSASSTRVTGSCASQSISRSGSQAAQLARDRDVALRVPEADGRRDVERAALAAARGRPTLRFQRSALLAALRTGCRRSMDAILSAKSRSNRLILTGWRPHRTWPPPSMTTSSPPVARATAAPRVGDTSWSLSPWMTSTGHSIFR